MVEDTSAPFCVFFPFEGGHRYCYEDLSDDFDGGKNALTLELPGHGTRISESLLCNPSELLSWTKQQLDACSLAPERPLWFFGHGFGAWWSLYYSLYGGEGRLCPQQWILSGLFGGICLKTLQSVDTDTRLEMLRPIGFPDFFLYQDKTVASVFLKIFSQDHELFKMMVKEIFSPSLPPFSPSYPNSMILMDGLFEVPTYQDIYGDYQQLKSLLFPQADLHMIQGDYLYFRQNSSLIKEIMWTKWKEHKEKTGLS
jgi:surfactin synthase thioesterase subunit